MMKPPFKASDGALCALIYIHMHIYVMMKPPFQASDGALCPHPSKLLMVHYVLDIYTYTYICHDEATLQSF